MAVSPLPGLAVLGLGAAVVPLDFAVNVAFPAITDAFALPTDAIRWVAVCYVLTYGSLLLGFGALGDRIGYLRVFRAGLALGALAFVLCAVAPSWGTLLAARVVQGVAAALVLSCAPALATLLVDASRRTWALSAFAGTQALAAVAAPIVGGLSVAAFGWPGVFGFRVPVVLVALAGSWLLADAASHQARRADEAFDARGAMLLATAVALLLLAPSLLGMDLPGGSTALAVAVTLAGAVVTLAFVRHQRGVAAPFLPPRVARDRGFALALVGACALQLACFAVPLTTPYFLLRGAGWSALDTGTVLSVWAVGTLAGSLAAARVVPALGASRSASAGAVLCAVGLAGLAAFVAGTLEPATSTLAVWLLIQGAGLGLFQVGYGDAVVATLPVSSRGVAGSLVNVTRTVGIVLGATAWMAVLQGFEASALATGSDARAAMGDAYRVMTGWAAVTAAGCAVIAARRG